MSNPYTNFNHDITGPEHHWPRTSAEEQVYGSLAALALKNLGNYNSGIESMTNTARALANTGPFGYFIYSDVGLPSGTQSQAAAITDPGAHTTTRSGVTSVERFVPAAPQGWAGGAALPHHYSQLASTYRRAAGSYGDEEVLRATQVNFGNDPSVGFSVGEVYSTLTSAIGSFISDPTDAQTARSYSLMAAIQSDAPQVLPAPEIDGGNGLTSQAANNPGGDTWRAPGYVFNYVIDVTDIENPADGNPFVVAANRFNVRLDPNSSDYINIPQADSSEATPTVAVLLPARTVTARTTLGTLQGTTSSGQVAEFDLQGRKVNLHFVAPWSNTNTTDIAQARTDARDDLNSTYRTVMSAGGNGGTESSQLGVRFANQGMAADIQVWCLAIESAATNAIQISPDVAVGNDTALGDVRVRLNLCKITDKKPDLQLPPCRTGILAEYTRVYLDGVYLDLPYSQRNAIELREPRLGSMSLDNVQVVRAGGAALYVIRTDNAVFQNVPSWGVGSITLSNWNCPTLWSSRLTASATGAVTVAGVHQDLEVDNCTLREINAAVGRSTDVWATADHLNATAIGATFAYTSPSFELRNSVAGETLGTPRTSGHYSETLSIKDSDFFTEAPYQAALRVDSAVTVSIESSDIFAGATTAIAGPNGDVSAEQSVYLAPNNLGDLPATPPQGVLGDVRLDSLNSSVPGGATDPALYGGGDPNEAPPILPERINTGSDLNVSDGLEFLNFLGGAWEPENGNPAIGEWQPLLYTYNTSYQNKQLRIPKLRSGRLDLTQRIVNLGGTDNILAEAMRTRGTAGPTTFSAARYLAGFVDYHCSGGPVFIKDGDAAPYYALSSPSVFRTTGSSVFWVVDPNIPQSADWDPVAQTGFGPQYVRAVDVTTMADPGLYNQPEPGFAVATGKMVLRVPGNTEFGGVGQYEVPGLTQGLVRSGPQGRCVPFDGPSGSSGANTPFIPDWLKLDSLTVGVDPDNGRNRCEFTFTWDSLQNWFGTQDSGNKHTGFSGSGTFFMSSKPTASGVVGYDRFPGTLRFNQVRLSGETINTLGQISDTPKWLHRSSGLDGPVELIDSDFTDVRVEHCFYADPSDDVLIRRCTFQRAASQAIQLVNRSFHYDSPSSSWYADRAYQVPGGMSRPTRDVSPSSYAPTSVSLFRTADWNINEPFLGSNYEPDNAPTLKRQTILLDDVHLVDASRGGINTKIGFNLTLFTVGEALYPANQIFRKVSVVTAFTEHQKVDARNTNLIGDMRDATNPYVFGSDLSTPKWSGGSVDDGGGSQIGYRGGGCFVSSATTNNQQGSGQHILRVAQTIDLSSAATEEDKAALIAATFPDEAPYTVSVGHYERYVGYVDAAYNFDFPGRPANHRAEDLQYVGPPGTSDTWLSLRNQYAATSDEYKYYNAVGQGYAWWSGNLKLRYAVPSYPLSTEGHQAVVPFRSGCNEWMIRDTSTGNMWWYNNDWRRYEEKSPGQYGMLNRYVNLGPITGNPKTLLEFDQCLFDAMHPEKTTVMGIRGADHVVIKDTSFIRRLDDAGTVQYTYKPGTAQEETRTHNPLRFNRYWRIEIDGKPMSSYDGFNDNRGTRTRRVTLNNLNVRPTNCPTDNKTDFLDPNGTGNPKDYNYYSGYRDAVRGTANEVQDAAGNIRWDNLIGWLEIRLFKVDPRSDFTPSGEGIGGNRSSSKSGGSATCENNPEITLQLSGLNLLGQTLECVLVPGAGPGSANGPDSDFMTAWAAAGYPLPELADDVVFPDGEAHDYFKYPAVFEPYLNDVAAYPLTNWSWVILWDDGNGVTPYESGTALFDAMPKVAGWVDPDDPSTW